MGRELLPFSEDLGAAIYLRDGFAYKNPYRI